MNCELKQNKNDAHVEAVPNAKVDTKKKSKNNKSAKPNTETSDIAIAAPGVA